MPQKYNETLFIRRLLQSHAPLQYIYGISVDLGRESPEPTDKHDTTVTIQTASSKTQPKSLQSYRTPKHKAIDHCPISLRPQQPQGQYLSSPPRETSIQACCLCWRYHIEAGEPVEDLPAQEYDEILTILEPYWHIFNLVLEYEPRVCVDHYFKPGIPTTITETERISPNGDYIQAYGSFVYASGVSELLRRGSSKFNHCDFSIYLFLCVFEPLLSHVRATIAWLAVEAKPKWVIHWKGYRPDPLVRHSVFSIKSRSGDEYIADFTIEQFGFESEFWLMCRRDYEVLCTTGKERRQPRPEEVEAARRGDINDWDEKAEIVRKVCLRMRDYRLEFIDRITMIRWLEALVREACWNMWHNEPAYRRF